MPYNEDRASIEALLIDYAWGIDSKDWKKFGNCFAEDCYVSYGNGNSPHPGGVKVFNGRAELVDYISRTHQPLDGSIHGMSNIAIEVHTPDTASARTYGRILLVLKSHPDGPNYQTAGYYVDELVKEDGSWRIKSRRYTRVWGEGNTGIIQAAG
jgi:hypothetical protein